MHAQLGVDQTHYFLEAVDENHFVKEGITTVLNFDKPLSVEYKNISWYVDPELLTLQPDKSGNLVVVIPLAANVNFKIRGLFYIDDNFIKYFEGTSLYDLVYNKHGCYAVSAFEIVEDKIDVIE